MSNRWPLKIYLVVSLLLAAVSLSYAQKIDKNFSRFYAPFQKAVASGDQENLRRMCYFPFQTMYWIDGINQLTEEEKQDGLLDSVEFERYQQAIFNADVQRLVPQAEVERVKQIDVDASGDYYKRLGKLVDPGSALLELYCQYAKGGGFGDDYFAFLFGRIKGEYRVLGYYTVSRIKR